MPTISTSRLVPDENVVFRGTAQGGILVHVQTGQCFQVNHVGAEVWSRLAEGDTFSEIVHHVALKYGVSETSVETDVQAICGEIVSAQLARQQEHST